MTRILNVEPCRYSAKARNILDKVGQVVEAPLSRAELLTQLPDYDALIVRLAHQIDSEIVDVGRRLKAVVTSTTGIDHIDVNYAQSKGVAILSLQGESEFLRRISATAEHTWALLLTLLRRIPQASLSVMNGGWDRDQFRGQDLDGRRLGIVGLGRIGKRVAGYGMAFGMDVSAYDPFAVEWVKGVQQMSTLPELFRCSDVLTIHVPLTPATAGLIGRAELALLPAGSVLVNTSRGAVLDESALVDALQSDRLRGAALDVICNERDETARLKNPLLVYARRHDNLLITPHIGGATQESMEKTEIFMAQKLAAFLHNMHPSHQR